MRTMTSMPGLVALVLASILSGCGESPSSEDVLATDTPLAEANLCVGRTDGWYCSPEGRSRHGCYNQNMGAWEDCACGCVLMGDGYDDVCKTCDFCSGKSNGYWCNGKKLVGCIGGATVSVKKCTKGCQPMPANTDDRCK